MKAMFLYFVFLATNALAMDPFLPSEPKVVLFHYGVKTVLPERRSISPPFPKKVLLPEEVNVGSFRQKDFLPNEVRIYYPPHYRRSQSYPRGTKLQGPLGNNADPLKNIQGFPETFLAKGSDPMPKELRVNVAKTPFPRQVRLHRPPSIRPSKAIQPAQTSFKNEIPPRESTACASYESKKAPENFRQKTLPTNSLTPAIRAELLEYIRKERERNSLIVSPPKKVSSLEKQSQTWSFASYWTQERILTTRSKALRP